MYMKVTYSTCDHVTRTHQLLFFLLPCSLSEADCLLLGSRVVVPPKCQEEVLKELHMGHPGIARMKAQACKGVCVVAQY